MGRRVSIVLASRNPGKIREFKRLFVDLDRETNWEIEDISGVSMPEVEETGSTFAENARIKALHAAYHTGRMCLGEDSGLEVDALGGAPGVRSHRFSPSGGDKENNELLLERLAGVKDEDRTTRYRCAIAVAVPGRVLAEAEGAVEGLIVHECRGENGFGYDPLFYATDLGKTLGEARDDEKDSVSHRRRALEALLPRLKAALARRERFTGEEGSS